MKNKSSIIIPAALIFLSMFSCANDQETKQVPLQKFSVANPEVRDIVYRLEYPGYLQSERIVEIIARTEGFLIENKIKPGQKVSEGDVLFIIEPKTYEDKLTTAEAALATAKSNLVFAQSSLDRIEEAAKSNAVSQIDLIQAQTNVDLCKSAIKTAEAQLSIAQTQLG
ncbi:MAG TPA: biotin/lipoyl-binding protein, partial [Candidatus Enterocola sp.]|nr:biotin/lipoyl-binding protein [Candidatus Enterocola sp.]